MSDMTPGPYFDGRDGLAAGRRSAAHGTEYRF